MFFNQSPDHFELYNFEFTFLPNLFSLYEQCKKSPGINMDESKFIDIEFLKSQFPTKYINWDNFKFEKKELSNNVKEFIYNFGEPKGSPLCYYGIFYIDEANNIYEYFTLEKTFMFSSYVVCGQKGSQHNNYGIKCSSKLEDFEKAIQLIIEKKVNPTAGFNSQKMEINMSK